MRLTIKISLMMLFVIVQVNSFAGSKTATLKELARLEGAGGLGLDRASFAGLKSWLEFNNTLKGTDSFLSRRLINHRSFLVLKNEGRGATFHARDIKTDGTLVETEYEVPQTLVPPTMVHIEIEGGLGRGIERTYETPDRAQITNAQAFTVTKIDDKWLRVQTGDHYFFTDGQRSIDFANKSNKIEISVWKHPNISTPSMRTHFQLLDASTNPELAGTIVNFRFNDEKSRLTVIVAQNSREMTEYTYGLRPQAASTADSKASASIGVETVGIKNLTPSEIRALKFNAKVKELKPRSSAESSEAARGLQINSVR